MWISSYEVCNYGVQVFGGYGYIKEYPQEQLLRDCKITQIYEGTNGIQAMDLLGRKLNINKGTAFTDLMAEINGTIHRASRIEALSGLTESVSRAAEQLETIALFLADKARSKELVKAYAFAYPFMEAPGDVVMAWMLLWRACVAAEKLEKGAKKKDALFYDGQLKSARYFIKTHLPITRGRMDSILDMDDAAVEIEERSFGGL